MKKTLDRMFDEEIESLGDDVIYSIKVKRDGKKISVIETSLVDDEEDTKDEIRKLLNSLVEKW